MHYLLIKIQLLWTKHTKWLDRNPVKVPVSSHDFSSTSSTDSSRCFFPIRLTWFLTTNARHTKYCGGYAPGDKLHRTCRQIGNLKGREQRELADDHPLKQIYEKRLNTINRYVKRGTLDADLAEVMKKLAKDKMLRALSNVAYAKGDYEKEMGQAALLNESLNYRNT